MSSLLGLVGGGVKSVQEFTITLTDAELSDTATISAVSTSKYRIILNGTTYTGTANAGGGVPASLVLTNSTTITATRVTVEMSNTAVIRGTIEDLY